MPEGLTSVARTGGPGTTRALTRAGRGAYRALAEGFHLFIHMERWN
jgi:hypothetical protein